MLLLPKTPCPVSQAQRGSTSSVGEGDTLRYATRISERDLALLQVSSPYLAERVEA